MLLAVAVGATVLQFHTVLGRNAGVTLTTLLLGLKALEIRNRRDTYVFSYLGLFGVATNFLYSQSALTAIWMVFATLGWITALVNANLPAGQPPLARRLFLSATLLALGVPAMVLLFVLFPRPNGPLWGLQSSAADLTGLSDHMDAGSIASLAQDDSVVFRARFHGTRPPQREMYWRGPVLSYFNGRQWTPLQPAMMQTAAGSLPAVRNFRPEGPGIRYTVTMQPSQEPFVFALDGTPNAPRLYGATTMHVRELSTLELRASRPITGLLRYELVSYPLYTYGPDKWSPALETDLELPVGDDPRTVAFGEKLARSAKGKNPAVEVAQAALQFFRQHPFRYSLHPGAYAGPDQIDSFLFNRRVGFCEHYAQAFVVLLRAAGVPARIVTGYQGGRENPIDHTWVVRQSDAHAWAEYWVAGIGWLRADPTAMVDPSRIDRSGFTLAAREPLLGFAALGTRDAALFVSLRNLSDAISTGWNQWVLGYSQSRQIALLRRVGLGHVSWPQLAAMAVAALCLAISLIGLLLIWERKKIDPWTAAYAALRTHLAAAGISSTPADPPLALAKRVRNSILSPTMIADACALLEALERWRYANSPQEHGRPKLRLAQLHREITRLRRSSRSLAAPRARQRNSRTRP